MTPLPPVTPELKPIARLIGAEALLRLVEWRGGTRLPVPRHAAGSLLAEAIGVEAATALAAARGGEMIKVPLARLWRVQALHGAGLSYAEIATRVGLTEAGVWRMLRTSGMTGDAADRRTVVQAARRAAAPLADVAPPTAVAGSSPAEDAGPRQLDLLAWLGDR